MGGNFQLILLEKKTNRNVCMNILVGDTPRTTDWEQQRNVRMGYGFSLTNDSE